MNESGQKKERLVRNNPEQDQGYYVYCVAETSPARRIASESLPSAIEEHTELELVTVNNLTAVISRVPMTMYSEDSLAEHMADAAWTAVRAMRHEQVVEHFVKRTSVAPLRFGTIYLERAGVERMLLEKERELTEIIERLRGREEWGVNVYCDRATFMSRITSVSARLRDLVEQAEKASPGQSYLMQKKIDAMRVDEARAEIARVVDQIENTLRAQSDDGKRLRVLKVEATEHGELKAKFAFLVSRSAFEEFRTTAERLAQDYQSSGMRLELTGPWPAYYFAVDTAKDLLQERE
jgi:Gas vesicle synthesis protein GvpL/GvpF